MKTLFCLEQTSLFITRLSPLKPKIPTLQPRRRWKLHAKAKGFGGASNSIQEKSLCPKKLSQKEAITKKPNGADDDKIPQVVLDRMIVRILVYVGVPLLTGMVILRGFSILKEENLVDIPVWLPFLTTFITFGASALGIAIGSFLQVGIQIEKVHFSDLKKLKGIGLRCGKKKMRLIGDHH